MCLRLLTSGSGELKGILNVPWPLPKRPRGAPAPPPSGATAIASAGRTGPAAAVDAAAMKAAADRAAAVTVLVIVSSDAASASSPDSPPWPAGPGTAASQSPTAAAEAAAAAAAARRLYAAWRAEPGWDVSRPKSSSAAAPSPPAGEPSASPRPLPPKALPVEDAWPWRRFIPVCKHSALPTCICLEVSVLTGLTRPTNGANSGAGACDKLLADVSSSAAACKSELLYWLASRVTTSARLSVDSSWTAGIAAGTAMLAYWL